MKVLSRVMPAQFTRMSTGPCFSVISATMRALSSKEETSAAMVSISKPAAARSAFQAVAASDSDG